MFYGEKGKGLYPPHRKNTHGSLDSIFVFLKSLSASSTTVLSVPAKPTKASRCQDPSDSGSKLTLTTQHTRQLADTIHLESSSWPCCRGFQMFMTASQSKKDHLYCGQEHVYAQEYNWNKNVLGKNFYSGLIPPLPSAFLHSSPSLFN